MSQSSSNKTENAWPRSLDAMTAATEYHELLLENEKVRVLDTRIAPGATVPVHTHRWSSAMYVMSFSDFARYDDKGNVLLDTRTIESKPQPGEALWSPPLPPHSLKNVGDAELRVITVELKD